MGGYRSWPVATTYGWMFRMLGSMSLAYQLPDRRLGIGSNDCNRIRPRKFGLRALPRLLTRPTHRIAVGIE
jgi:hypothetical protein